MWLKAIFRDFGCGYKARGGFGQMKLFGLTCGQIKREIGCILRISIPRTIFSIIRLTTSEKFPDDFLIVKI